MSGTFDWQGSFAAGVLGPALMGRVDLAKYQVGLKAGENIFIHAHGGASNRSGTRFVAEVTDSEQSVRLVPFERDEVTPYVLAFNAGRMAVIQRGAPIMSGGSPYSIASPYSSAQAMQMNYAQSIDDMYIAHPALSPRRLSRVSDVSWSFSTVAVNPAIATPGAPAVTAADSGDGRVYRYMVSAVVDGIEGRPSPVGEVTNARDLRKEGQRNTVSWTALATAPDEYRVYRELGGVFGYIGFTVGSQITLTDDNIQPDTTKTPRQSANVFSGAGNYPAVVAIAQQRLVWAATDLEPELILGSVVGDYENYTRARIIQADDRFRLSVTGEKLNRIRAMADLQQLIAFTGSAEHGIGDKDGVLNSVQPRHQKYGASGTNGVRPLSVADSVLYIDRSGRLVRDLVYSFERNGFAGSDLSLFVPHYLTGRSVVDWAYCHAPFGLVWVVVDDGSVLSLTYKREQEVWAWTRHDFGGFVESVCSVYEDGYDALYLAVRRNINGVPKRYIERLCNRTIIDGPMDACFLDCARTYEGPATDTITGLDHLEGMTVNAIADNDVYPDLVVQGGSVTLPYPATKAHVGMAYESHGETLPLYVELQGTGASRGLPVKATETFVQMENTRGLEVTTTGGSVVTHMVQTMDDLALEIPLFTGLARFQLAPDINDQGTIIFRQRLPLPMTILGISPKWTIMRG